MNRFKERAEELKRMFLGLSTFLVIVSVLFHFIMV